MNTTIKFDLGGGNKNLYTDNLAHGSKPSIFVYKEKGKKGKLLSLRTQLLLLAFSLFIMSTILSMIAYLTDTSSYTAYLRTASSSLGEDPMSGNQTPPEFGVELLGNMDYTYDSVGVLIDPGASVKISPKVKNIGEKYEIYVFVEATIPNDFTVDTLNENWYILSEEANDDSKHYIYYYGNKGNMLMSLMPLHTTPTVFENISLSEQVGIDKSYIISITAHAIQRVDNQDPRDVWELINGQ